MNVDECIAAYIDLMKTVFEERSSWLPVSWTGRTQPRFDSKKLKSAIVNVITGHGAHETELLNNGTSPECRVWVAWIYGRSRSNGKE